MNDEKKVVIGVHERLDEPGYVVKVEALGRVVKFPTNTFEEAEELARSFKGYVEAGAPVSVLVGLDGDE